MIPDREQKPTTELDGRLIDECLNETLFTSLAHARFVLDACRHDYNPPRPHSKLRGETPAEIAHNMCWGACPQTRCLSFRHPS
jgi:putative transposase